ILGGEIVDFTPYTITFNSQGGSSVAAKDARAGAKITAPANPSRAGYSFGGWYKEAACQNAWNFATEIVTQSRTLYAKWTEIKVTSVAISPASTNIYQNETKTLLANVLPETALNKAVEWGTSNAAVATVSSSGVVTAVSQGTATITATAKDGSGKSGTCSVTILPPRIPVTSMTLNPVSATIKISERLTITPTITPPNASDKSVTWTSSNTRVATVTNGSVLGVGVGTTTITATSQDNPSIKRTCAITVYDPVVKVSGVAVSPPSLTLKTGETAKAVATVSPSNATDKSVTWKSSNTAVAIVDANGKVTAKAAGTATITATAKDGSGKSASCTVTVQSSDPVEAFVERLYTLVLNRTSDPAGIAAWVNQLKSKQNTGSDVAYGFFFSNEMTSRALTNAEYIEVLYKTLLGRQPDANGKNAWLSEMSKGQNREQIFAGFVNSNEFTGICAAAGIERGTFSPNSNAKDKYQIQEFVKRLYSLCLGRQADAGGLNGWTEQLVNGTNTGTGVAYGFFFSPEMENKRLSNADYVEVLYKVLLGRNSDPAGKAEWVSQLAQGKTRLEIFNGFAYSPEFDGICKSYGIRSV
ncbi:MAG: DUF4214 domain-containing protein, partial [Christensenellaceae bacterium]